MADDYDKLKAQYDAYRARDKADYASGYEAGSRAVARLEAELEEAKSQIATYQAELYSRPELAELEAMRRERDEWRAAYRDLAKEYGRG